MKTYGLFIPAAGIPRPGGVQDLADGDAIDFFAANRFMQAKTGFINGAEILISFILAQMLAGVAVKGSATATFGFPLF